MEVFLYYQDKVDILNSIFSKPVKVLEKSIRVGEQEYPVENDVIILIENHKSLSSSRLDQESQDIQFTFGEEWETYPEILPEHKKEFEDYFDLVEPKTLREKTVCDLGCGIGRWSYFLADHCKNIILIDFSAAIHVARKNLKEKDNAVFIQGDLRSLPVKEGFADFLFSLGVLHHLPQNALGEIRKLAKMAPKLLIYLYYSLDNRPAYYRWILSYLVDPIRIFLANIKTAFLRDVFTSLLTIIFYLPLITMGRVFALFGKEKLIPLAESYKGKSFNRLKQDVYDRFFTSIEQRFSRQEILGLQDTFKKVTVSQGLPYWHFLCER